MPNSSPHSSQNNVRAALCRAFNQPLSIETITLPKAQGHELKIAVKACAICHSDISYWKGHWGGNPPLILGHEAAGTIIETGEKVETFKIGDRVITTLMRSCGTCPACRSDLEAVCAAPPPIAQPSVTDQNNAPVSTAMNSGAFAEQVLIHERQAIAMPDRLGFDIACLLGCGVITGFGAVTRVAKVKPGETIIVIGTGGVGLNALQAARIAGAAKIIAIDIADDKAPLARRLGATHFINPQKDDALAAVLNATESRGVDAAFVAVGTAQAIANAIPMTRDGGRIVILGMPADSDLLQINAASLAAQAKTIIGTKMGSAMIRHDIPMLIDLYQNGTLELASLISTRFPFDQINQALATASMPSSLRVVLEFPQ